MMLKWIELTQEQKDACAERADALRAQARIDNLAAAREQKRFDFELTALSAADAYRAGDWALAADLIGALRQVVKAARRG